MNRRTFQLCCIYELWGVIGALLAIPAGVYLLFPPRLKKREEWVEVAGVSELAVEKPQEVVFRRNRVDGWKLTSEKTGAWVVKVSEQEVIAFAPQCPHLGCAYHWVEDRSEFLCPCHASTFSIEGKVLTGPAPRALDRYEVKLEGEKLFLRPVKLPGVSHS